MPSFEKFKPPREGTKNKNKITSGLGLAHECISSHRSRAGSSGGGGITHCSGDYIILTIRLALPYMSYTPFSNSLRVRIRIYYAIISPSLNPFFLFFFISFGGESRSLFFRVGGIKILHRGDKRVFLAENVYSCAFFSRKRGGATSFFKIQEPCDLIFSVEFAWTAVNYCQWRFAMNRLKFTHRFFYVIKKKLTKFVLMRNLSLIDDISSM